MRRTWKILLPIAAAGTACFALVWRPAIAPVDPPAPASFASTQIAQGATLAAIGDCAVCHTDAGEKPFTGGLGLNTPFGVIHSTNITPDPDTGIGRWSEAAFARAMRGGIARDGRHLYPALPYPHFAGLTDADMTALYAFIMTRTPYRIQPPRNTLSFPADYRTALAFWNLLFLKSAPWQPDPAKSAEWNRGGYLVESLGHCGACHTPRNIAGAEKSGDALAGSEIDGWDAPALQARGPAGAPWTVDALTDYLRTGFATGHGAAAGPMTSVTHALAQVPEADVHAIAVFIQSGLPRTPAPQRASATQMASNAIFAGACGNCHASDAPMTQRGAPSLSASSAVNAASPRDVIQTILHGIPPRDGLPGPTMPSFGTALSDAQIAELTQYVRTRFGHGPGWTDLESQVRAARQDGS